MTAPRAIIAGTGRAGTSFLVQWLGACGVPVGELDELDFDDRARAGWERNVHDDTEAYLVKDPWLHEYLHTLDPEPGSIEAMIVPVRDLRRAALSRIRQERTALVADAGMHSLRRTHGYVPGGAVYSLSVTDQERVLAVGQATLIEWSLARSIPLYLLHHPRLVNDPAYTVDALSPWLLRFCTREHALECFERISRPGRWMTEPEEGGPDDDPERVIDLQIEVEALHVALAEERARHDESAAAHAAELAETGAQLEAIRASHSYRLARRLAVAARVVRRRR